MLTLVKNLEEKYQILQGVIDMHVHAAPDVYPRKLNEVELIRQAKSAGMRGVLLKSHHTLTADRAWLLRKVVRGIHIFGGLVLNTPSCGGLNPDAVDTAIRFGAKEIWMPTISSAHHLRYEGEYSNKGITILLKNDKVNPKMVEILDLIAEHDVILGTGHLSIQESRILVDLAIDQGVKKILITHPEWRLVNMPAEIQRDLVRRGAIIEHCYYATTELGGGLDPREIVKQIRSVGAEHCIIATDLGQPANLTPISGMTDFMKTLMNFGISKEEIDTMAKKNPAKMLNLSIFTLN